MILTDCIIPFHEKDKDTIKYCCKSLFEILNIKRIFLIGKKDLNIKNTFYINEDSLKNIVNLKYITSLWEKKNNSFKNRSGWIYQQILKLSSNEIIQDISEDFLVCDSDIIFLKNPYKDINNFLFPYQQAYTKEYHKPYRLNYEILMKEKPESGISFINHHMVFNKKYLNNLKKFIENKNNIRWDLAILNSLDYNCFSNFSEYDLYGNWIFKYEKEKMINIKLNIKDINNIATNEQILKYKNKNYDILSAQAWRRK